MAAASQGSTIDREVHDAHQQTTTLYLTHVIQWPSRTSCAPRMALYRSYRGGRVVAVAVISRCRGVLLRRLRRRHLETTDAAPTGRISRMPTCKPRLSAPSPSRLRPNVLYVGMGELLHRGRRLPRDGVYKSTGCGKTWTHLGLEDTRHIAACVFIPPIPIWSMLPRWAMPTDLTINVGISLANGGKTWDHILFRSDKAGAIDLSMDPHNPASCMPPSGKPNAHLSLTSGGPDSSLYKSTDGGETWTELTNNRGCHRTQRPHRRRCVTGRPVASGPWLKRRMAPCSVPTTTALLGSGSVRSATCACLLVYGHVFGRPARS